MNFSAILDISSFFIGMIINLLLIALICYYFKRKYENLEIAQNEQAKVLYQLLQQNTQPKVININDLLKKEVEQKKYEIPELEDSGSESDSDSDEETDDDNDSDGLDDLNELNMNDVKTENEINTKSEAKNDVNEIKTIKLVVDEPTSIEEVNVNLKLDLDIEVDAALDVDIEKEKEEKDYSKMTIKQLKDVLSTKGININNNKMKKNEMIELIEKSSITINE
jgi:hypothetical protein